MKIVIKNKYKLPLVIFIPNFIINPKFIKKYILSEDTINKDEIIKLIYIVKKYVKENGHFTFIEVKNKKYYIKISI